METKVPVQILMPFHPTIGEVYCTIASKIEKTQENEDNKKQINYGGI